MKFLLSGLLSGDSSRFRFARGLLFLSTLVSDFLITGLVHGTELFKRAVSALAQALFCKVANLLRKAAKVAFEVVNSAPNAVKRRS